jgi:hypothetical protein
MVAIPHQQTGIGGDFMLSFLVHFIGDDHLDSTVTLFKAGVTGMLRHDGGSIEVCHHIPLGYLRGIFHGNRPAFGDGILIAHHLGVLNPHQTQLRIAV